MKPRYTESDLARTIQLLESLRGTGVGPEFNVEPAVARRLRGPRLPHHWMPGKLAKPVISFREFAWGAAASLAMLVLGATGLIAVFSPEWLSSPSTALSGSGSSLLGAGENLARSIFHSLVAAAARLSSAAPYIDSTLTIAAQTALVACVAMFALTVLVVSHEARGRRVTQ